MTRLLFLLIAWTVHAGDLREAYARAERLLPANTRHLVLNASVTPHWIGSDRFWYERETREGKEFWQVDAPQRTRKRVSSIPVAPAGEANGVRSPDGRREAILRNFNVWVREVGGSKDRQLTNDGESEVFYGSGIAVGEREALGKAPDYAIAWSPDSKRLATIRLDARGVSRAYLVRSSGPVGASFFYPMAGDPILPRAQLVLADVENGTSRIVSSEPWLLPGDSPVGADPRQSDIWWSDDSRHVFWIQMSRARLDLALWTADLEGNPRKVLEEHSQTRLGTSNNWIDPRNVRALANGDVIWFSERDGWGHLYLYDTSGRLKVQITSGSWLVRELLWVDELSGSIFFTAGGREPGSNPYYRKLYRTSVAGGKIDLLTPEEADHTITFSPDGRYFLDTYSRLDTPPVTVLRASSGERLLEVERSDIGALSKSGWRPPEAFVVKAADGLTDLYGAIYKPSNFDPRKRYAVIDDIYPSIRTPVAFAAPATMADYGASMAELGFIVVALDARGASRRSKAFADAGYGQLAGRLDDHVAVIRELGRRHPYLDLTRVGVYGHSVGGGAAARAILEYPDFFRAAVCSAGTLDLTVTPADWTEWWMGPRSKQDLLNASPVALAERLRGKLLVAHGELDHPEIALRFADALIRAGKDFELAIIPERGHNVPSHPYFIRKSWDFFVRHLLNQEPPSDYRFRINSQTIAINSQR